MLSAFEGPHHTVCGDNIGTMIRTDSDRRVDGQPHLFFYIAGMLVALMMSLGNHLILPNLLAGQPSLLEDVAIASQARINPWATTANRGRIWSGGQIILSYEETQQIVHRGLPSVSALLRFGQRSMGE